MASILMGTSILTAFAQNDVSEFIKNRNSYPFWNGSLKRDIQGFKPGMTESEAKQALSGCEVSGHKVLCPGASKDESFELSLTEHTRPRVVKDVTYVFPAGGATLGTMAKNVKRPSNNRTQKEATIHLGAPELATVLVALDEFLKEREEASTPE